MKSTPSDVSTNPLDAAEGDSSRILDMLKSGVIHIDAIQRHADATFTACVVLVKYPRNSVSIKVAPGPDGITPARVAEELANYARTSESGTKKGKAHARPSHHRTPALQHGRHRGGPRRR